MTEEKSRTTAKLDRSGEASTLQGIVGDTDAADIDIFGYEVIYTTGEFRVDREDFLAKADEVGIPSWMLPRKTQPHYAFGRAIDDLLDGREEVEIDGQRVRFVLDRNNSRYSWSLDARVYFSRDMTTDTEGRWIQQQLGVIRYNNPDEGKSRVEFIDRIDPEEALAPVWGISEAAVDSLDDYDTVDQAIERGTLRARMEALFERHQESHLGKGVNNMTYYLVDQWTDSIRLRDAAYFVPASHTYIDADGEERPISDLIDAFSDLYDWLDVHADKPRGAEKTEMHSIEIMDTERQREMVESKVESHLSEMAQEMAHSAIDALDDDDTVASEVAGEVGQTLEDLRAVAGEYDSLLDGGRKADLKVQNAVKRAVRRAIDGLGDEESELVEELIEETEADLDLDD